MDARRRAPALRPLPGGPGPARVAVGLGLLAAAALTLFVLRWQVQARAVRLLDGEAAALATIAVLVEASTGEVERGAAHPGLAAIAHAAPQLQLRPELGDAERAFAHDEVYMYALGRLPPREGLAPGYELRAWPLHFGITGDSEFLVTVDGALLQGNNPIGRSGVETGFPPPFPEPTGEPEKGRIWWPRELPGHR